MPRNISPEIVSHLASGKSYSVAFLVLIEFDAPYRLAFTSLLDSYEYLGDTFTGLGTLGSVSMPQGDGHLSPKEYTVKLSGISDEALEAATQIDYLNKKATCWAIYFDDEGAQLGDPMISWRGLTDQIGVIYGETSSINISVRDRLVDWERPRIERYNNGDQVAKYPNDKFFEFISEIATKDAPWPEGAWFRTNAG